MASMAVSVLGSLASDSAKIRYGANNWNHANRRPNLAAVIVQKAPEPTSLAMMVARRWRWDPLEGNLASPFFVGPGQVDRGQFQLANCFGGDSRGSRGNKS